MKKGNKPLRLLAAFSSYQHTFSDVHTDMGLVASDI